MSSAVGALLGNENCKKRLACLSGRHLSHIDGASSIALLVTSAKFYLPDDMKDHLTAIHNSIMYSDDCDQYLC